MEHMPEFSSEEEFNRYFKRENEITNKYRDSSGMLTFNSKEEFYGMLRELMPEHDIVELNGEENFCLVPKPRKK